MNDKKTVILFDNNTPTSMSAVKVDSVDKHKLNLLNKFKNLKKN